MCGKHYERFRRYGRIDLLPKICGVDGCKRAVEGRGMCKMHYTRCQRYGDPLVVQRPRGTPEQRFWRKVDRSAGCWLWTAALANGYGRFYASPGKTVAAHRFAYELLVGPIPEGLQLDHLCRNRACVNPAHLEPVTQKENILRGEAVGILASFHRSKTHCPQGHPYDGANTLITAAGSRACRECGRRSVRERRARQKAAKQA